MVDDEIRGKKPSYSTEDKLGSMVTRCSWERFRASGLAWWINRILHTFGWALVFAVDPADLSKPTIEQKVVECYPARCSFRGFNEQRDAEGFAQVTAHMEETLPRLKADLKIGLLPALDEVAPEGCDGH